MSPACKCSKGLHDCPTPYTCGVYYVEGQQLALEEPSNQPWSWIDQVRRAFIAVVAVILIATAIVKALS